MSGNKILVLMKGHNSDTNVRKITCNNVTCNNPKLDLVNMNAYITFGEILSIGSQDIELKQNFGANQGHNPSTNVPKMSCDNANVDLVNMNAYIKFGYILSIISHNIERKRNFDINKGP